MAKIDMHKVGVGSGVFDTDEFAPGLEGTNMGWFVNDSPADKFTNNAWGSVDYWPDLPDIDFQIRVRICGWKKEGYMHNIRQDDNFVVWNWIVRDSVDAAIMMILTKSGVPPHLREMAMLFNDIPQL